MSASHASGASGALHRHSIAQIEDITKSSSSRRNRARPDRAGSIGLQDNEGHLLGLLDKQPVIPPKDAERPRPKPTISATPPPVPMRAPAVPKRTYVPPTPASQQRPIDSTCRNHPSAGQPLLPVAAPAQYLPPIPPPTSRPRVSARQTDTDKLDKHSKPIGGTKNSSIKTYTTNNISQPQSNTEFRNKIPPPPTGPPPNVPNIPVAPKSPKVNNVPPPLCHVPAGNIQKSASNNKISMRQDSSVSSDSFSQTSSPSYTTKTMETPLLPHMSGGSSAVARVLCNGKAGGDKGGAGRSGSTVATMLARKRQSESEMKDMNGNGALTKSASTPASLQTIVRFHNGSNMSLHHRIIRDMRRPSSHYVSRIRLRFRLAQVVVNAIALLAIGGGLAAYFKAYPSAVQVVNNSMPAVPAAAIGGGAGVNPAPGICLPVIVSFCQYHKVPYNFTVFPNYMGHFGQRDAQQELEVYDAVVDVRCYELAALFLCSVFVPKCGPTGQVVRPCQKLCSETKRRCGFFLDVFGLALPDYLECSLFPDSPDPDVCVGHHEVNEAEKRAQKPVCPSGFQCDVTRCIPRDWKCDGHVDCEDQSDELNCEECSSKGMIHCGDKRCMAQEHLCDGKVDCPLAQDERNCSLGQPIQNYSPGVSDPAGTQKNIMAANQFLSGNTLERSILRASLSGQIQARPTTNYQEPSAEKRIFTAEEVKQIMSAFTAGTSFLRNNHCVRGSILHNRQISYPSSIVPTITVEKCMSRGSQNDAQLYMPGHGPKMNILTDSSNNIITRVESILPFLSPSTSKEEPSPETRIIIPVENNSSSSENTERTSLLPNNISAKGRVIPKRQIPSEEYTEYIAKKGKTMSENSQTETQKSVSGSDGRSKTSKTKKAGDKKKTRVPNNTINPVITNTPGGVRTILPVSHCEAKNSCRKEKVSVLPKCTLSIMKQAVDDKPMKFPERKNPIDPTKPQELIKPIVKKPKKSSRRRRNGKRRNSKSSTKIEKHEKSLDSISPLGPMITEGEYLTDIEDNKLWTTEEVELYLMQKEFDEFILERPASTVPDQIFVRLSEKNGDEGRGQLQVYLPEHKKFMPACVTPGWNQTTSPVYICNLLGYTTSNGSRLIGATDKNISPPVYDMQTSPNKSKKNLMKELGSCKTKSYTTVDLTCTNYICGKIRKSYAERATMRIVGGTPSKPGDWPFLAALLGGPEEVFYCAGVLIADQWVLTASHCVGNHSDVTGWTIQLGITRRHAHSYFGQKMKVRRVVPHPMYNLGVAHDNDIALFQLASPVTFHEHLLPVCLPPDDKELRPGINCTVIGWGKKEDKDMSEYEPAVNEVEVPVLDRDLCNTWLENRDLNVTDGMICAGFKEGGKDACQGDSGGPLLCKDDKDKDRWFVGGIVSWGIKCAHPHLPGVYAYVPKYIRWIKQQMALYSD